MKKILGALLGVTSLSCVGPFSEDLESHYPNIEAARAAGAFTRGWLPEILPDDAQDIWEIHNLDTNLTWGCFTTPGGPTGVRAKLERLNAGRVSGPISTVPRRFFRGRSWWPAPMSKPDVEAYEFKEEVSRFTVVVGLDPSGRNACFHRRT